MVGFSFGLRTEAEEPNPSNEALAMAVVDACRFINFYDCEPIVVTQWEITKALKQNDVTHSVELRADGTYLDSKGVWDEAKKVFEPLGITRIVIVAQPFLHLPSLKLMVEKDGYEVLDFKVPDIPFDSSPSNTQPWTRSKLRLLVYAVKVKLGMSHGYKGRQNVA